MNTIKAAAAATTALACAALLSACAVKAPEPVVGDIADPGSEVTGATIVLPAHELKWSDDGGDPERILRSATVTFDEITAGSPDDFADLLDAGDLEEIAQYDIAYFHYTVTLDDGALGNGQVENPLESATYYDTTGAVASGAIIWMAEEGPGGCDRVSGQDLVSKGTSSGCEILILEKGADLDRVEYIGFTTDIDVADAPVVWKPTE